MDYGEKVQIYLHQQGFEVELDRSNHTLAKKVRGAQLDQWNFILVVGEKEQRYGTVDIRSREQQQIGSKRVDEAADFFRSLIPKRSNQFFDLISKAWSPNDFPVVHEEE